MLLLVLLCSGRMDRKRACDHGKWKCAVNGRHWAMIRGQEDARAVCPPFRPLQPNLQFSEFRPPPFSQVFCAYTPNMQTKSGLVHTPPLQNTRKGGRGGKKERKKGMCISPAPLSQVPRASHGLANLRRQFIPRAPYMKPFEAVIAWFQTYQGHTATFPYWAISARMKSQRYAYAYACAQLYWMRPPCLGRKLRVEWL